jgi:hypothetical protein
VVVVGSTGQPGLRGARDDMGAGGVARGATARVRSEITAEAQTRSSLGCLLGGRGKPPAPG